MATTEEMNREDKLIEERRNKLAKDLEADIYGVLAGYLLFIERQFELIRRDMFNIYIKMHK